MVKTKDLHVRLAPEQFDLVESIRLDLGLETKAELIQWFISTYQFRSRTSAHKEPLKQANTIVPAHVVPYRNEFLEQAGMGFSRRNNDSSDVSFRDS